MKRKTIGILISSTPSPDIANRGLDKKEEEKKEEKEEEEEEKEENKEEKGKEKEKESERGEGAPPSSGRGALCAVQHDPAGGPEALQQPRLLHEHAVAPGAEWTKEGSRVE
jgi:hypothetical protein